jgi:hypothetical protein
VRCHAEEACRRAVLESDGGGGRGWGGRRKAAAGVPRVEVRVPRVVGGGGGGGTPVTSECRRLGWGQRGSGGGLAARWRCCRLGRGWLRGGGQGRRGGSPEEEEKQRGCRSSGQWVGPEDGG